MNKAMLAMMLMQTAPMLMNSLRSLSTPKSSNIVSTQPKFTPTPGGINPNEGIEDPRNWRQLPDGQWVRRYPGANI